MALVPNNRQVLDKYACDATITANLQLFTVLIVEPHNTPQTGLPFLVTTTSTAKTLCQRK